VSLFISMKYVYKQSLKVCPYIYYNFKNMLQYTEGFLYVRVTVHNYAVLLLSASYLTVMNNILTCHTNCSFIHRFRNLNADSEVKVAGVNLTLTSDPFRPSSFVVSWQLSLNISCRRYRPKKLRISIKFETVWCLCFK